MPWSDHVIENQTPEKRALAIWLQKRADTGYEGGGSACGCMGPQRGEPLCPCAMNFCVEVDGRWYEIQRTYVPTGEDFKVVDQGPVVYVGDRGACSPYDERTEFNVLLTDYGADKVKVIKAIRYLTGLGLYDAKQLTDNLPSMVKIGIALADARNAKFLLEEAGGTAIIA